MPTESTVKTQIQDLVKILDDERTTAVSGYLVNEAAYIAAVDSAFAADTLNTLAGIRSSKNNILNSAAALLTPNIRDYGKLIEAAETDTNSILARLYQYMIDNNLKVKSRVISFGSPAAAGGNVGTGTIVRLTTDENSLAIENVTTELKTATCVQDANSGRTEHEELFVIHGVDREPDDIIVSGSGRSLTIAAISGRTASSYVRNPSFESFTGTLAVPTEISSWTVTNDIGNFELVEGAANIYRDFEGITTPRSVKFKANDKLSQLFSVAGATYSPIVPYHFQVAYNREIGAVSGGTLTIRMGAVSASVSLASGTGWQILQLDADDDRWFDKFNQTAPDYEIEVSGLSSGVTLLVDDVIVTPMTKFDGSYLTIIGGRTKFLRDDEFTFTDTETGSKIQYWIWRSFGRYLPHGTGGAITWADPS